VSLTALQQPSAWDQATDRLLELLAPVETAESQPPVVIRDEADLAEYLRDKFGMVIPSKRCCAGHTPPWEAFCDAYFARAPVAVWKASRGFGGKSQTLALLGNVEAATLRADINILGGTGEQATRVLEAMDRFWKHPTAPRELLASEPAKRETKFVWGNWIRALMASTASVRGPHPQRLRMDEVDEMDLTILDAAMGQTMARTGIPAQTVLSSTHHYSDATMTEVLRRAHDRGWPVYEWCWRETLEPHGWLPQAEVNRKRLEVTTAMWEAEYDLQEPSADNRAIVPEAVEAMFTAALGKFPGTIGKLVQIEGPRARGRYVHGADWARKQDTSQVYTLRVDVKPMRLVAWIRERRRAWPYMVGLLEDRIDEYGGRAIHDGTGLGDVIDGYLTRPAEAFILVGRDRQDVLSEYVSAIERGEIQAPLIEALKSEHKFATTKDLYEPSGHPPDGVVAGALAYRASRAGKSVVATVRAGEDVRTAQPSNARRVRRQEETEQLETLRALVQVHGPDAVEAIKRLADPTFNLPEELRNGHGNGNGHRR
jgi:hypothetical protein